ncbi:MAG: family 78 glycoside hydrolase catalytic domain [Tepidisphaeraceae bacterium]
MSQSPFAPDAHWIAFPNNDADKTPEPAPQFRTEFALDPIHGNINKATLTITGVGCYDCQINGHPVSDHVLDPGWTNYNKTVLYNSFDVAALLQSGDNAIGVTLGNGPYNVLKIQGRYTKFAGSFGVPKLRAQIDIDFADNTQIHIASGAQWKTTRGPVVFNHQYGGEDYDARRETHGWTEPHFDDNAWQPAAEISAPGTAEQAATLMLAPQAPDKICKTFQTQKVTQPTPGVFVYDLGQNMSGWPAITVSGPAGATIKLVPGELLDKNGLVTQRSSGSPVWYSYTLKGEGAETWHPLFSYYGFRYVQVTGVVPASRDFTNPAATQPVDASLPVIQSLAGQFVHADLPSAGSFSCSNDTLNRIHTLINNAILSNSQSILTDCPHREKLGWLEQDHLMAHAIMMNWDVHGIYTKIENDIADAQHSDGLIPDIAPEYAKFAGGFLDSPEWGSTGIIAPWYTYLFYGDQQPLADHYDTMKRYNDYLASKANDNIISFGLGDWYDVGPKRPGEAQLTSKALTCTATWYQDLIILQKTAELLGKIDDAKSFADRAAAVKTAFNQKFFHTDTNQYENGSQTANAMPLVVNLVPAESRDAVVQNLVQSIRGNHNRITAGDVGFSYVVRALTDAGQGDLLFDMATQSDGPGYVDQLRKGATTLTEAWDAGPASSQNHLMLGHIESWFYEGLGGIQLDATSPGFSHFFLRPEFPKELTFVHASHITPFGQITSNWERDGSQITCTFDIPAKASATLTVFAKTEELASGHYIRQFSIPTTQP